MFAMLTVVLKCVNILPIKRNNFGLNIHYLKDCIL